MGERERFLRGTAWTAGLLGWTVLVVAARRSARHRPGWFDPDDGPPCARLPSGGCSPADAEAALADLWVWVGTGGALVLLATALTVVLLPTVPTAAPVRALPGLLHAVVAGAAGALLCLVGTLPALLALLFGAHAVPAVVLGVWLTQAGLLALLDTRLGAPGTSPRQAARAGLGVSGVATALVVAAVGAGAVHPGEWGVLAGTDGVLVGLGVVATRWLRPAPAGRRRGVAVLVVAGVAAAVLLAGNGLLIRLAALVVLAQDPPLPQDPVATVPPATPVPEPRPGPLPPAPVTAPLPPPVPAEVPCTQAELDYTVVGFDAALGARGAAVQARNTGDRPCWVEGVPVVTLLQGGRSLSLTVDAGHPPSGGPAAPGRVGIAPGRTALAALTWRTYAGWADAETPQSVTVALDPSQLPVPAGIVGGPPGAAPFDIADGGRWAITPWAPPWN